MAVEEAGAAAPAEAESEAEEEAVAAAEEECIAAERVKAGSEAAFLKVGRSFAVVLVVVALVAEVARESGDSATLGLELVRGSAVTHGYFILCWSIAKEVVRCWVVQIVQARQH